MPPRKGAAVNLTTLPWIGAFALDDDCATADICPASVRTCEAIVTISLLSMEQLAAELRQESRSERMEQRVKPTVKQAIELAATLSGTDTSEFVVTAAFQAAVDRIRDMRRTELSGEQAERFFAALEQPPAPTRDLRELMAKHDALVEED